MARRSRVPAAQLLIAAVAVATVPGDPALPGGDSLPGAAAPREPLMCDVAVMIGDRLRCDDAAPRTIAEVCGLAHPSAAQSIAPGDRVDPWPLCTLGLVVAHRRMDIASLAALDQPTDLNHATVAELEGLPGIGPALARRIVEARPHASVDALAEVKGIGPRTLDRLRGRVVVSPTTSGSP